MPLQVREFQLTQSKSGFRFEVSGKGIAEIQVEVFALSGRRLFVGSFLPGGSLVWNFQDSHGRQVANGVYLYTITVRGTDGRLVRRDVRKLVIVR